MMVALFAYNFSIRQIAKSSLVKFLNGRSKLLNVDLHFYKSFTKTVTSKTQDEFVPVYWFPKIRLFAAFNRLKYYQAGTTALLIPTTLVLHLEELCTLEEFQALSYLGVSLTVSLTLMSMVFNRFVAAIYVHRNGRLVKISYVNFHGSRVNEVIPIDDLKPFSELKKSPTDRFFLILRRYSCAEHYKFAAQFGSVLNEKCFSSIFKPY